jgi:hypothetical protein
MPAVSRSRALRWLVMVASAFAIAAAAWWMSPPPATDSGVTPAADARIAPAPAASQTAQATAPAAKREAPGEVPFAPAQAGQRASIDPATGQLRPIEHDDVAKAAQAAPAGAARRSAFAAPQLQERLGPDGAVSVDVPEDLHTFTVATRTADGKVVIEHATGPKGAAAKTRAGAKGHTSGVKEGLNDR